MVKRTIDAAAWQQARDSFGSAVCCFLDGDTSGSRAQVGKLVNSLSPLTPMELAQVSKFLTLAATNPPGYEYINSLEQWADSLMVALHMSL